MQKLQNANGTVTNYHSQYFAHVMNRLHAVVTIIMFQMTRRMKYKCMFVKESKILNFVLLCVHFVSESL